MSSFNANLDYILFICGLALFALAGVSFFLRREKPASLAWRWLGYFGLAAGAGRWLALIAFSLYDSALFAWLRVALLALAFGLLLEFARRSARDTGLKAPPAWIYAIAAALCLSGGYGGFSGVAAAARYGLGLFSCGYAAFVVIRAARPLPGQLRAPLTALGWLLGVYALVAGGVTPNAGVQPASWLNYESFWRLFGFHAQSLEAAAAAALAGAAWLLASAMWLYSRSLVVQGDDGSESHTWRTRWLPLGVMAAVLAAGWFGTSELGRAERLAVVRDGRNNASILYFRLNEKLLGIGQTAAVMSESTPVVQALKTKSAADIAKANVLLDRFQKVHEVDVCYLLDAKGVAVASSNRNDPSSFVGDDYAFRPYFKEAVQGRNYRYFALGNTTRLRGYYVSAPVTDSAGKVVGVAAIKKNLDALEEEMRLMPYAFFVSPEGVVFLSGRSEFLFGSLWTVDQAARYELLKSNQFGPLEFRPLWRGAPADGAVVYLQGEEFYLSRLMCGADGWSLVALTPTRTVLVTRFYGVFITFVLCLLSAGLLVIFAQYDRRRSEELELLRVREEKRALTALLPVCAGCRKPRDDKDYKAKVDAYISSHLKASASQCLCPDCAKKVYSPGRG